MVVCLSNRHFHRRIAPKWKIFRQSEIIINVWAHTFDISACIYAGLWIYCIKSIKSNDFNLMCTDTSRVCICQFSTATHSACIKTSSALSSINFSSAIIYRMYVCTSVHLCFISSERCNRANRFHKRIAFISTAKTIFSSMRILSWWYHFIKSSRKTHISLT